MTADRGVEEVNTYLGWIDRLPVLGQGDRQPAGLQWEKSNKRSPPQQKGENDDEGCCHGTDDQE